MNIVIPMAGAGSRFAAAGYSMPKPFIPIKGKAMIEHVLENVGVQGAKHYLICRLEHLSYLLNTNLPYRSDVAFVPVQRPTEGAACTVLHAESFIDSDEPLVIANSDQWIDYDRAEWSRFVATADAAIMTFQGTESKWSYALERNGRVVEVAEKRAISDLATAGVYSFRRGSDWVRGAKQMIREDRRVNGEFYVCPVFNELVEDLEIKTFPIRAMYGLGTPEDLQSHYERVAA